MPERRYCPYEGGFFDATEFRVVGRTPVHVAPPPHRAFDGWLVATDGDDVVVADGDVVLLVPPDLDAEAAEAE